MKYYGEVLYTYYPSEDPQDPLPYFNPLSVKTIELSNFTYECDWMEKDFETFWVDYVHHIGEEWYTDTLYKTVFEIELKREEQETVEKDWTYNVKVISHGETVNVENIH